MTNPHVRSEGGVPIALASQIPAGSAHPVILNGQMLALWRDEAGHLQLWEDRCPHRGMRLSFGFVRGDRLSCLYHGWQFGRDGGCKYIPAHPDMTPPDTITVPTFPVEVQHGMIVASPSGDAGQTGDWLGVRSICLDVPCETLRATFQAGRLTLAGQSFAGEGAILLADGLALGFQPISETRTALHLSSVAQDVATRRELARHLVALRTQLNMEGLPS